MSLINAQPPLDAEALAKAEARLGVSLPESYRRLLRQHNGARLTGYAFGYDPDLAPQGYDPSQDGIEVSELFGIGVAQAGPGNLLDLGWACHQLLAESGRHLPPEWIWIGRTEHDDELFLAVEGPLSGAVFLLYARDEFFEEDFEALFDAQGRLAFPEELMISHDIARFWHGAVRKDG
ncbi:MAG: hypothetical protein CVV27_00530 [Candidatus Melainabacteria bacterium HGW-Melainabacteria-1]|nr:MAG: hypothetical protein CVV27_00530 [Candidatus Melainabacteria bacterium HGW-Melainabacteria-1]